MKFLVIIMTTMTFVSSAFASGVLGMVDFDQHVLSKLHDGNQMEIKMGKLALENSEAPDVRAFGRRLINDHSQADKSVLEAAEREHVLLDTPPRAINDHEKTEMAKEDQTYDRLSQLKGKAFDQLFKQVMIQDHKQDLSDLNQALPKLKDRETRQVVRNMLPVIRKHEKIATELG